MLSGVIVGAQGAGVVLPAAFLAYYLGLVRFRSIPRPLESWYLIIMNAVLVQVFGLSLFTSIVGRNWPGRDAVRAGMYLEFAAILMAQLALAVAARRGTQRKDDQ